MLQKCLSCLLFLLPFAALAQEKGVHFEHDFSWSAIQAKAKAQNKYIFVDCFTTWCGPCKYMATSVFPQEEAGNFFNDKFISVAVQLDTTGKDNAAVKHWYADAHALMAQHDIRIFPTYLIYSPDGQPLHRIAGSSPNAGIFIALVQQAFDTAKAYYHRLAEFRLGRRDTAFLRSLALDATTVYDLVNGRPVADAYLSMQADAFSPGSLEVILRYTGNDGDKGFSILTANAARIDLVMGAGTAESHINDILMKEYMFPKFSTGGAFGPDWKAINRTIAAKYPVYANAVTEYGKIYYYMWKEDWTHFQKAIIPYMQQYGANASSADLDQYADILYKMGKKDDAIAMEEKAMALAAPDDKPTFARTIDRMKKGEKTWQ